MKTEVLPRLNAEDKRLMKNILSAGDIKHKFAVRLQTVSRRASGEAANDIARFLGIHTNTVSGYVRRYNDGGLGALVRDKTRKPGKAPISAELKNEICRMACTENPENATHWSTRSLAKRFKVSRGTVGRILRERGIKPHLVKRFGCGNDPQFAEKLTDVAGLYMNPPDNAIVLCADEKSRLRAPGRTAPVLPMLPHVQERQTVDYERHGTTTLFAAPGMLTGNVIGERGDRLYSVLEKLGRSCEKGKVLHIIAGNYATHKTAEVKAYIKSKGGRFETHFIPARSSRLNMIERRFGEITNRRIRRESRESAAIKKGDKRFHKRPG